MVKKNTCVFISGKGSNLKNLIKRSRDYNFPINIKFVISDNINAYGLKYAKQNSIPFLIINTKKRNYENKIINKLNKYHISLVCLAGYMKIISKKLSVRQAESLVRMLKFSSNGSTKKKDPNIVNLEEELTNKIGMRVFVRNKKNNSGTISLEYKGADQLDRLVEIIKQNY